MEDQGEGTSDSCYPADGSQLAMGAEEALTTDGSTPGAVGLEEVPEAKRQKPKLEKAQIWEDASPFLSSSEAENPKPHVQEGVLEARRKEIGRAHV